MSYLGTAAPVDAKSKLPAQWGMIKKGYN